MKTIATATATATAIAATLFSTSAFSQNLNYLLQESNQLQRDQLEQQRRQYEEQRRYQQQIQRDIQDQQFNAQAARRGQNCGTPQGSMVSGIYVGGALDAFANACTGRCN